MYMILWWKDEDSYLDCVKNKDGSFTIFETLDEADAYANNSEYSEDMRVISIEGVHAESITPTKS